MIAKKEWFERRKYGGWGVIPKTWQGWLFLVLVILPFVIFQSLPHWSDKIRLYVTIIWLIYLLLEIIPIMIFLKRDEREDQIEAISERNASWFMSLVLTFGILFEVFQGALNENLEVNLFLIIALAGGALVKTISNFWLEKKM